MHTTLSCDLVHRIGVRDVDLARPDETVWQAAERMHQRGVGSLVVVDEDHVPIGIITDRDLVERVLCRHLNPHTTMVEQIMTPEPQTVHLDGTIATAIERMREGRCRRLPITDRQGHLAGLVSLDDILMHMASEMSQIGQLLQSETPRALADSLVEA